jgi:glutathione synthase
MRKDPPVDVHYLYTTQLLDLAKQAGVLVLNDPQALRDANEKIFATHFSQCMPPTIVSADPNLLQQFLQQHKTIVLKELDSLGGQKITALSHSEVAADAANIIATLQRLTANGTQQIMAQQFLPAIKDGDKRILLIDGKPVPYALSRIPQIPATNTPADALLARGNLAAGAVGVGATLTERELWICAQLEPTLKAMGLFFVGIDVIGDYLTEINVTSPTCIREIDKAFQVNVSAMVVDGLVEKLSHLRLEKTINNIVG